MKNAIITGATGMIGGIILKNCLDSEEIGKITSIVRKGSSLRHPKLKEVIHDDFSDLSGLEEHFKDQDIAFYCIGVYTGQVPRKEFRKITVDFTIAFADMLKCQSPGSTICFLSGQGADQKEKSRMMFAKDKGAAEHYLIQTGFKETYLFRPAYIYPVKPRREPNMSYTITRYLYPLMKKLTPNSVITSEELGAAMFKAGIHGAEKTVLENSDIKSIL